MDPFSLKTRIEMFKGDHLKLDKAEVDPKSTRLSDQQKFDDYQRRFKFKMNMLHVQTQVAHQVMHLSFVQWNTFMQKYTKWMGTFVEETSYHHNWLQSRKVALQLYAKSMLVVQQVRSYNLNQIQKVSIWDYKSLFNEKIFEIIDEENLKTKTLQELSDNVLMRIKQWIIEEQPEPIIVNGPWRQFLQMVIDNKGRDIPRDINTFDEFFSQKSPSSEQIKEQD